MKLHSSLLGFAAVRFAANNDGGSTPAPAPDNTPAAEAGPAYMRAAGNRQQDFGKALKEFIRSTSTSMKKARELSDMAIEHFIAHGDCVYFQSYTDEIAKHAKNYVRVEALVAWATTFAPLTFDKGKWTKDKERANAMDWDNNKVVQVKRDNKLVGYGDISFWEFAPEKKVEPLDAESLLAFIMGRVNSKKTAARIEGNAAAEATLAKIKATLATVQPVKLAAPEAGQQAA